jgi:hypothetical protein
VPNGTAQVLGGNAHEGRLATTPVRGEMRRCRTKDGDIAAQCQVFRHWLIKRHDAEKIGKFVLLLCNTID